MLGCSSSPGYVALIPFPYSRLHSRANRRSPVGIHRNKWHHPTNSISHDRRAIHPTGRAPPQGLEAQIALYTGLQCLGVTATIAISQTIAAIGESQLHHHVHLSHPSLPSPLLTPSARPLPLTTYIGFPVLIILLVPLRWLYMRVGVGWHNGEGRYEERGSGCETSGNAERWGEI